jgi:hypothetical protein
MSLDHSHDCKANVATKYAALRHEALRLSSKLVSVLASIDIVKRRQ